MRRVRSLPDGTLCSSSRTAWVQKIKAASEQYIDTEKKKREKAYQGSRGVPGRVGTSHQGALGTGRGPSFRAQAAASAVRG